jgi:hypothetical protein
MTAPSNDIPVGGWLDLDQLAERTARRQRFVSQLAATGRPTPPPPPPTECRGCGAIVELHDGSDYCAACTYEGTAS